MGADMTAREFADIQRGAGMTDGELAKFLGYENRSNGIRKVRRFKAGSLDIPPRVRRAMLDLQGSAA